MLALGYGVLTSRVAVPSSPDCKPLLPGHGPVIPSVQIHEPVMYLWQILLLESLTALKPAKGRSVLELMISMAGQLPVGCSSTACHS